MSLPDEKPPRKFHFHTKTFPILILKHIGAPAFCKAKGGKAFEEKRLMLPPPSQHLKNGRKSYFGGNPLCWYLVSQSCLKLVENDRNGVDTDNCTARRYVKIIGDMLR